jgi:peptidoglycan/xylan/chitin deacetylase (PgdA/CDA1 family)
MNPEHFPLGVCVFPEPDLNRPRSVQYPNYVYEILDHAGVCYTKIDVSQLAARLDSVDILLTIGERSLDSATQAKLRNHIARGGGWISIGGICGLDDVLGTSQATGYSGFGAGARTLGEGYLVASDKLHPMVALLNKPLHFFNGLAMRASAARVLATALDAHGRQKNEPILFEHRTGNGLAIAMAVDLTGTIVHIQQGRSVTRDGVPASDGTAPVSDGVLKSGDGGVLDWIFDRDEVPGAPGFNAYLRPAADQWRELLLRTIFHVATQLNVALPVLWYWPRNLPAVAHMSHDTDGNTPENAHKLLALLKQADIRSSWCVILPGYDKALMNAIRTAGHEFATHYDAMTEGLDFCREQFDRQITQLKALFNEQPVMNKNHYLRWEGDMEFFDWCHAHGLLIDQSKGASKTGEAGFNFGTSHAYFPMRFNGQFVDVLEMATITQDLEVFAPYTLCAPLLDAVIEHHGIFHLLFHPAHMLKDAPAKALVDAAALAKSRGLEWWTARELNEWERVRRKVKWHGTSIEAGTTLQDATLLTLGKGSDASRWGFNFSVKTLTLQPGERHATT